MYALNKKHTKVMVRRNILKKERRNAFQKEWVEEVDSVYLVTCGKDETYVDLLKKLKKKTNFPP